MTRAARRYALLRNGLAPLISRSSAAWSNIAAISALWTGIAFAFPSVAAGRRDFQSRRKYESLSCGAAPNFEIDQKPRSERPRLVQSIAGYNLFVKQYARRPFAPPPPPPIDRRRRAS
jgi:hypothetical protein